MSLPEFEGVLKEVVNAKRLSASKMAHLTDLTMKNIEHDTQLVSVLYRTHKSLPTPAAKVSSLYVFDALSRAAKHHATKHGLTGDAFTQPGNSASFLFKVGGVVEGLFQDMVTYGSAESKEKAKKILDIWVKGSTFPSAVLSQLSVILKGTQQVPDISLPPTSPVSAPSVKLPLSVDPRTPIQSTYLPPQGPTPTNTIPTMDPQAALLALLTQAAASTANISLPPTSANTGIPPHLGAAQLAVIQQLAHTTVSVPSVPQFLPPTDRVNIQNFPSSSGVNGSSHSPPSYRNEPRIMVKSEQTYSGYRSPESEIRPDSRFDERDNLRGRHRGGLRTRGGGDRGVGRTWDHRDRDYYRDSERDQSPLRNGRGGRSRSRSPHSRYTDKKVSRFSSPPRRSSATSPPAWRQDSSVRPQTEPGKDEFGRDIRPESPRSPVVDNKSPTQLMPPKSPVFSSEPPKDPRSPLAATTNHDSNHDSHSVTKLVSSNISSTKADASLVPTGGVVDKRLGMENFNLSTFDYTSPASWEALGKMWQVTNGYLPSTEELMAFVMSGGSGQATSKSEPSNQDIQTNYTQSTPSRGRGRGRGTFGGGRDGTAHDNGRGKHGGWGHEEHSQTTDAIVLGGGGSDSNNNQHPMKGTEQARGVDVDHNDSASGSGGRMQRIGDKWVFVRATAMDVS